MNERLKYKILTFIRYCGDGFYYPFFALFIKSKGFAESKIGLLVAIAPFLAIFLNPLYSRICNNIKKTKICLGIISILEGLVILAMGFANSFGMILALTIIIAIFGTCHYGLMDALLALYAESTNTTFSSVRIYGSAAYVIATAIGGYMVKLISYPVTFSVATVLFVLAGIFYLIVKPIEIEENKEEIVREKDKYKELFKNKKYFFFLIFYFLMMGVIFTNNAFLPTYLETRGIDSGQYGLVYSYCVICECIVLALLNIKKFKFNNHILLIISSAFLFIRLFVCYLNAPIWLVIATTGLRGAGYAIMLHVSYRYIIDLVGERLAQLGIMVCTLFYFIFIFILNNVNGILIENYGYTLFYLLGSIGAIIILIMSIFLKPENKISEESK